MLKTFKEALTAAANWEVYMTDFERTKIPFADARQRVVKRIFRRYKDQIIKKAKSKFS